MATKTLSITEEAYNRLLAKKHKNESFTDVINRITNKINVLDFAGILDDKEAEIVSKNIKDMRILSKKRLLSKHDT